MAGLGVNSIPNCIRYYIPERPQVLAMVHVVHQHDTLRVYSGMSGQAKIRQIIVIKVITWSL